MIKVIGKRLLISQCDRNIGVEGDNNTHRLCVSFSEKFLTDTFADGYGVVAKVASKKSEKAVSYPMMRDVSLSSDADSVWFLDLTKYILDQPGELLIQLEVTKDLADGSGYLRWNSEVASLFVGASLESEDFSNDEAQLSAFEEVLSEIAAIGAETADNAKSASEHAESAQVASAEAEQALIEVNQKYDEFMGLTGGFEAFVEAANAHYDNKNNPHEVTAEQLNVYTKEAADKKFNEKADTSHTHPAAGYALVDLTAYGFSGNVESGFSLSMDTTTEPYTPADVSIFAAGDIIKLKFSLDGTGSSVTINDEGFSLVSIGGDPVTEPVNFEWEGELKAAVRMTVNDLSTIHVIDVQKLVDFGFVSGKLVENFNKLSAGGNIVHSNSLGYLDLSEYGMLPFNNETYPHEPPSSTEGLYSLDHAAYEVHSFRINLNGRHIKLKCELFGNTFISINDATLANVANETHRYCWEGVVKGNVGVYLMEGNGYISIELFDDLPMSLYYGQSYTKEETDALFENASLDLSFHVGERNNPHKVTAEQTGAYTKEETDALLSQKANSAHIHENAVSDSWVDLTQFGFKQSASGEYYVETNTETWEQADISFMEAGDRVKVSFEIDGGGYVYINDQVFDTTAGTSISNYTWEGVLTKPIRVLTSLCVIYMDVYKKGKDGFMSGADKVKLEQISNMLVPLMISAYGMKNAFSIYVKNNIENATLTELTEQFFKSAATTVNETYTSQFYLFDVSNTPDGTKLADNAGLVCEPSTNTAANRDDYADLPLFACFDVNYTIDETTLEPVIHEIKGITDGFTSSPTDSFVGVLQMTGWVRRTVTDTQKTVEYRAQKAAGYKPLPEAVRASDNSVRPYVIHAKYAAGYNSSGKLSSVSGVQPATYRPGSTGSASISHDDQIALWRARGNQYCGSSFCDIAFIQLMLEIKYATLGNAGVMSGCRSYYLGYAAAVSESGVNRVVLTASQASAFVVGSRVSIGTGTNRAEATCYDVHDIATIASIEDVIIEGVAYKAVVLATEAVFDTVAATTYITSQPWLTGSTDGVQGNDGSPTNNTSDKEPFKIQGIEVMLGMYEVLGDTTLYEDATVGYTVYADRLAADIVKSKAGANAVTLGIIPKEEAVTWKYNAELNWDANDQESYMIPTQTNGTSSTGYRSAIHRDALATVGWREWQVFGYLIHGGVNGLACADLTAALGYAYWHFGTRPCGSGGNRGEYKEV